VSHDEESEHSARVECGVVLFRTIYNYIEGEFNRLLLDGRAIGVGYSMG
jgi:hypothetical protein